MAFKFGRGNNNVKTNSATSPNKETRRMLKSQGKGHQLQYSTNNELHSICQPRIHNNKRRAHASGQKVADRQIPTRAAKKMRKKSQAHEREGGTRRAYYTTRKGPPKSREKKKATRAAGTHITRTKNAHCCRCTYCIPRRQTRGSEANTTTPAGILGT